MLVDQCVWDAGEYERVGEVENTEEQFLNREKNAKC